MHIRRIAQENQLELTIRLELEVFVVVGDKLNGGIVKVKQSFDCRCECD